MRSGISIVLCLAFAALPPACAPALRLPPDKVLLATYFTGDGVLGTYLAVSTDGYRFDPLLSPNLPILAPGPESGGHMHDAWLGQGPDGRWRMAWTISRSERGIGYSESEDLAHWSTPRVLDVAAGLGVQNCWAPEIAYDPDRAEYLIVWASTIPGAFPQTAREGDLLDPGRGGARWNHRLYFTTTRDFNTFAPARLLVDPGFECIDPSLVHVDGPEPRWVLLFKDESRRPPAKWIMYMQSTDPTRWTGRIQGPISGRSWAEGPTAARIGDVWRIWWDRYGINRWGAAQTSDWEEWVDVSGYVKMPEGARHGTVILVDRAIVERLKETLATSH